MGAISLTIWSSPALTTGLPVYVVLFADVLFLHTRSTELD